MCCYDIHPILHCHCSKQVDITISQETLICQQGDLNQVIYMHSNASEILTEVTKIAEIKIQSTVD